MTRAFLLSLVARATAAGVAFFANALFVGRRPAQAMGGMMGNEVTDMMGPDNMRGPMRTGMELFERHALIHRTVTNVPGGVRAVTESDDPQTASLIQAHVMEMYERLDQDRPFPYPMSRSVPAMFANSRRYQRTLARLPRGVAVTETSRDPKMVAVIRAHAREINGFVREGMPAMMHDMMDG